MTRGRIAGLLLLLLSSCGGSSGGSASNPHGFNFDISDYPGVVVVPLDAFREDRPTNGTADGPVQAALFERIHEDATTMSDTPFQADWDTMIGLMSNGSGDQRIPMRFFLAYEVIKSPSSGVCTVRIHVIEGLPFDATREALATYEASATVGENDRDGVPIGGLSECTGEASERAFDMLVAAGHFDQGWSLGPPAHPL